MLSHCITNAASRISVLLGDMQHYFIFPFFDAADYNRRIRASLPVQDYKATQESYARAC